MKIKHNLTREGKTISGKILKTIFEEGERRGEVQKHYTEDWNFAIKSKDGPQLCENVLYVFGSDVSFDKDKIEYTYDTEEKAKKVMQRIDEFTVDEPEFQRGELVEVRDFKDETWTKRIYLDEIIGAQLPYVCVGKGYEYDYNKDKKFRIGKWKQIRKKDDKITIKTEEGDKVKISKEKLKEKGFTIKED